MTAQRGLKCRWCAQAQTQHREMVHSPGTYYCSAGRVAVFRPVKANPKRQSQSYDPDEVALLDAMLRAAETGEDRAWFKRQKDMPRLAAKIRRMAERVGG